MGAPVRSGSADDGLPAAVAAAQKLVAHSRRGILVIRCQCLCCDARGWARCTSPNERHLCPRLAAAGRTLEVLARKVSMPLGRLCRTARVEARRGRPRRFQISANMHARRGGAPARWLAGLLGALAGALRSGGRRARPGGRRHALRPGFVAPALLWLRRDAARDRQPSIVSNKFAVLYAAQCTAHSAQQAPRASILLANANATQPRHLRCAGLSATRRARPYHIVGAACTALAESQYRTRKVSGRWAPGCEFGPGASWWRQACAPRGAWATLLACARTRHVSRINNTPRAPRAASTRTARRRGREKA